MSKVNYLFLFLAASFALFILFVSLQSANKNRMTSNSSLVSNKFYIAKEILPDHSLYPTLMLIDRLRLELASAEKRTYLLMNYGNRRLFYSRRLLEEGNSDLAFITLTKALKYANQALSEGIFLFEESSFNKRSDYQQQAFFILEKLPAYDDFVVLHRDQFSNDEKVMLETLAAENHYLAEKLRYFLNQIDL
jgi:hypothetical protein